MPTSFTEPSSANTTFNDAQANVGAGFGYQPFGSPPNIATKGYGDPSDTAFTEPSALSTTWTEGT